MNRSVLFYSLWAVTQAMFACAVFVRNGPGWNSFGLFVISALSALVARYRWTD